MRKILLTLLIIFSFSCIAVSQENVSFVDEFGFVLPDEQGEVDVGEIAWGFNAHAPSQHLKKGDSFHISEHHNSIDIVYLGQEGNLLVFEKTHQWNDPRGGGGTEKTIISVRPYTFDRYMAAHKEKERMVDILLLNIRFYRQEPIFIDWLKNRLQKEGLEKRDTGGNTFLLNATSEDTIQFLLDLGADLHAVNHKGENILMRQMTGYSNGQLSPRMLRFLLDKGIDKDDRNAEGKTITDMLHDRMKACEKEQDNPYRGYACSFEENKIDLEILTGKENCSGVYDEASQRCLDCFSPESYHDGYEHISTDAAQRLCAMCDNRYYLAEGCHLNIKTDACHQKEGYWMAYFDDGSEDECNPCEEGDLRMTTYDECRRCPNHIPEDYDNPDENDDEPADDIALWCYSCSSDDLWTLSHYSKETIQKYCSNWEQLLDRVEKHEEETHDGVQILRVEGVITP